MAHTDDGCPLLSEWRSLMHRCPEEKALARVAVDLDSLADSLSSWIELHRERVMAGEIPAKGTVLDIDYTRLSLCLAYLSYMAEA